MLSISRVALIILALALIATPALALTLDSGSLTLTFDTQPRLILTGISSPAGPQWLTPSATPTPIWHVNIRGAGTSKELSASDFDLSSVNSSSDQAEFTWLVPLDKQTARVTATVRCPKGSHLSYWTLRVDPPTGWTVTRADFPVLPNISHQPGLELAVPSGWGLEYDVKQDTKWDATYPSCGAPMQFQAFYAGNKGLYLAAHDPKANHKYFNIAARADGIGWFCMHWPAEVPGTYTTPEMAVGVFNGNYWDAAQVYREFTFKTPWGRNSDLSKRPVPQWLLDNDLWLMSESTPARDMVLGPWAREFFGMPLGFHWYRWHRIPHDVHYPEYFPPKAGFAGGIEMLQDVGLKIMPYINGRCTDPGSVTWVKKNLADAAAKQPDGSFYPEEYIKGVPLNVMCPYSQQWQDTVVSLASQLANIYGVDGVYIDQIGAAGCVRCFDPTHGHPVGGGSFWADGYRTMISRVRESIPQGTMLATEENAEPWIDLFDAQLIVNTPINEARPIPLFTSVYSGRSITFGSAYNAWDDVTRSIPFRWKMGRQFIWGGQLGWANAERIHAEDAIREAEYLRSLARTRRFTHEFVVTGRFMGEITASGDNPTLTSEATNPFNGKPYTINTPAVLASLWQSKSGRYGILLTNISDETRRISLGLPAGVKGEVNVYGSEGLSGTLQLESPAVELELGAREARVLEAKQTPPLLHP